MGDLNCKSKASKLNIRNILELNLRLFLIQDSEGDYISVKVPNDFDAVGYALSYAKEYIVDDEDHLLETEDCKTSFNLSKSSDLVYLNITHNEESDGVLLSSFESFVISNDGSFVKFKPVDSRLP